MVRKEGLQFKKINFEKVFSNNTNTNIYSTKSSTTRSVLLYFLTFQFPTLNLGLLKNVSILFENP